MLLKPTISISGFDALKRFFDVLSSFRAEFTHELIFAARGVFKLRALIAEDKPSFLKTSSDWALLAVSPEIFDWT